MPQFMVLALLLSSQLAADLVCPTDAELLAQRRVADAASRDYANAGIGVAQDKIAEAVKKAFDKLELEKKRLAEIEKRGQQCIERDLATKLEREEAADLADLTARCPTAEEVQARSTEVDKRRTPAVQRALDRIVRAQRRCDDDKRSQDDALDQETRGNVGRMQVILSFETCYVSMLVDQQTQAEKTALGEIKTEQLNSKIAGVIDKVKLYELQNQVVEARNRKKTLQSAQGEMKKRQMKDQ